MIRCEKCGIYKITPNSKCACNFGQIKEVKKNKPIKKVSEKKKKRLQEFGTEGDFFKKIFKEKEKAGKNYCMICDKEVKEKEFGPICIPHILPKGKYPQLRYFKNNVGFVCNNDIHHKKFDLAIVEYKKDKGLKFLEDLIISGKKPMLSKYINKIKNEI